MKDRIKFWTFAALWSLTIVASIWSAIKRSCRVRRRILRHLSIIGLRRSVRLTVVLRVSGGCIPRIMRRVRWSTLEGNSIIEGNRNHKRDLDKLVILIATARCTVVIVGLWSVVHWRCVASIRLSVTVVRVAALWRHAVVVVPSMLVLIHVLRRVVLVWSAMAEGNRTLATIPHNFQSVSITYGGTLL